MMLEMFAGVGSLRSDSLDGWLNSFTGLLKAMLSWVQVQGVMSGVPTDIPYIAVLAEFIQGVRTRMFRGIVLPGTPPRILVLDIGLIAPVRVVAKNARAYRRAVNVWREKRVQWTYLVECGVGTEVRERTVVIPLSVARGTFRKEGVPISYSYAVLYPGSRVERISAKRARHLILEHCSNYMPSSGRQTYVDYYVRSLQWIREFFYVSAHEVERLDVERIRSGDGVVDGRCAKYILLNKYRALLVT